MLDTATSAPPVTRRITRLAITAAVTAGMLNAALATVQLLAPAQPTGGRHFIRPSDYVIEILFAGSLLTASCSVLLLARYHRELSRWGTFGTIAAIAYALGTGLSGISSVATAARGAETLDVIQLPSVLLWLAAGLLMTIAAIRARALPVVIGLGFRGRTARRHGAGQVRSAGPGRPVDRRRGRAGQEPAPPPGQLRDTGRRRVRRPAPRLGDRLRAAPGRGDRNAEDVGLQLHAQLVGRDAADVEEQEVPGAVARPWPG
jgi:hypothetical protein